MAATPQTVQELTLRPPRRLARRGADFCGRRPLGAIGAAIILVMVALAATAGWIAPYHPLETDYGAMLAAPNAAHWLGTDAFGRDVLSRIIYGSRTALMVGLGASLLGATLGSLIGVASAYFGGRVDLVVQRIMDVFFAFPVIILALAVVAVLGTGAGNVILAIATPMVPRCARVVRASALAVREMPYVDAARASGFGHRRIILRHMLPNVMAPILIMATAFLGEAILLEGRFLPRPGRPGADRGLGPDAACGGAVRRERAMDGDLPGHRDQPWRVRLQSLRRLAARRARSTPAHAIDFLPEP